MEDLNKYIPKKAFRAVEKLNIALKELARITGEDNPELLDTSTGVESFFTVIGEVRIENGCIRWTQEDHDWHSRGPQEEDWCVVREDEDNGEMWFDEYDFKDQISYLNKCIKKAIKYFKEYNPEWDDDEDKRDKFLNGDE